jgi:hypothetical protein
MMIAAYIIVGIVLLILLIGLFVSKDMNYEKTIEIKASITDVWAHTNSLKGLGSWSPWNDKDPNMQKFTTGTDGTIGASETWISAVKNVGEGSQTITGITEPNLLETRLEFIKPFKSTASAFVRLSEDDNNRTTVTWGFKSQMPYPMNLMKLFVNFEKAMDKDFGAGLNKLKSLVE